MGVCVMTAGGDADAWAAAAAEAATAAGSATHIVDARNNKAVAAALPDDMRVLIAASAMPLAYIATLFATPRAQASRKIVVIVDGAGVLPLFDMADMLIFSARTFADALEMDRIPEDVAALAPVQSLLKRHNQGVVVRFAEKGVAAIWADRTLFVAGPDAVETASAMARFGGTIAAAVDQGIGPQPALEMALADPVEPATRQSPSV